MKLLLLVSCFGVLFSSENRINALGGEPALWQDDEQIINMFPSRISQFNLFQLSNVDSNAVTSVKYISGDQFRYGFYLDGEDLDKLEIVLGSGNWGLRFGTKYSSNSLEISSGVVESTKLQDWTYSFGYNLNGNDISLSQSIIDNGDGRGYRHEYSFGLLREFKMLGFSSLMLALDYHTDDVFSLPLIDQFSDDVDLGGWDGHQVQLSYCQSEGCDDTATGYNFKGLAIRSFDEIPNLDIMLGTGISLSGSSFLVPDYLLGPDGSGESYIYNGENLERSVVAIPIVMGIEGSLKEWVVFRAGFNKLYSDILNSYTISSYNQTTSYQDAQGNSCVFGEEGCSAVVSITENSDTLLKQRQKVSDMSASFGLGFKYKGFSLDILLKKEVFKNPIQRAIGFEDIGAEGAATISYTW